MQTRHRCFLQGWSYQPLVALVQDVVGWDAAGVGVLKELREVALVVEVAAPEGLVRAGVPAQVA